MSPETIAIIIAWTTTVFMILVVVHLSKKSAEHLALARRTTDLNDELIAEIKNYLIALKASIVTMEVLPSSGGWVVVNLITERGRVDGIKLTEEQVMDLRVTLDASRRIIMPAEPGRLMSRPT